MPRPPCAWNKGGFPEWAQPAERSWPFSSGILQQGAHTPVAAPRRGEALRPRDSTLASHTLFPSYGERSPAVMGRSRLREARALARGCRASKWQSWDLSGKPCRHQPGIWKVQRLHQGLPQRAAGRSWLPEDLQAVLPIWGPHQVRHICF
ncbi:neuronal calcium sensor 1 isoform X6 [Pteropus vampyrus]|uniref:Neuronal calcium sensor 1 isoform X6 n=1 Tax=Pteropus vampyrus TaxID=132908 RepID=A0A6P6CN15_PTEVA|nr:neuronal calcium sensor 1 isoform X6 [Pteropus vampyrus]